MAREHLPDGAAALFGLAAWETTRELMSVLHRKGAITKSEGDDIIDCALRLLEGLSAHYDGASLLGARALLEATMASWHERDPPPKPIRLPPRRRAPKRR